MASSAMDAAVDIIRRKIYGLKKEAVQEVAKVEELENVTKESNEAATENEKKLRELMKVIREELQEMLGAYNQRAFVSLLAFKLHLGKI